MKTIIFLASVLAVTVALPADTYNPEYDNFNVKELVENDRLLKNYGNCFLTKGPCTAEGADIKKIIPEALKTTCAKCTPKQRQLVREFVNAFEAKFPEMWKEIVQAQDPKGEYHDAFEKFIKSSD